MNSKSPFPSDATYDTADLQKIEPLISATVSCFQHISKRHTLFHVAFLGSLFFGFVLFLLFISFLANSFLMAITVACFFFASVMYFVLRLYFQEQKPRQFLALREEYLSACKQKINASDSKSKRITVAKAAELAASALDNKEPAFYEVAKKFHFLKPTIEKLSRAFHWRDVHLMKELFLLASIDEYTNLVKSRPTSFDSHAHIACAYISLASHYATPISKKSFSSTREELKRKFRFSAERAIEELTILKEYAPNNPWVHIQLAKNFRELKMPEKEIEEYEACVRLSPSDVELVLELGVLYFKQGLNAKGLKVYEKLKSSHPDLAVRLISYYGRTLASDPLQYS